MGLGTSVVDKRVCELLLRFIQSSGLDLSNRLDSPEITVSVRRGTATETLVVSPRDFFALSDSKNLETLGSDVSEQSYLDFARQHFEQLRSLLDEPDVDLIRVHIPKKVHQKLKTSLLKAGAPGLPHDCLLISNVFIMPSVVSIAA